MPGPNAAAPDVRAEILPAEAAVPDPAGGDLVQVTAPRGALRARLRTVAVRDGVVPVPFPYGCRDARGATGRPGRAADGTTASSCPAPAAAPRPARSPPSREGRPGPGRRPETGLLLPEDLCAPHPAAVRGSPRREILARTARAARDRALLDPALDRPPGRCGRCAGPTR
ncbi:hypothetical protein [Streptomyces sp. NPDC096105]|uniref:hypothetical protein n=1 Tax=Streptomyces sp. NPDC096105 TaxID=3366074 RepID=UPI0037FBC200